MKVWRCTDCGNLVMKINRPTRCLCCRKGEGDVPEGWVRTEDERLYQEVEL